MIEDALVVIETWKYNYKGFHAGQMGYSLMSMKTKEINFNTS